MSSTAAHWDSSRLWLQRPGNGVNAGEVPRGSQGSAESTNGAGKTLLACKVSWGPGSPSAAEGAEGSRPRSRPHFLAQGLRPSRVEGFPPVSQERCTVVLCAQMPSCTASVETRSRGPGCGPWSSRDPLLGQMRWSRDPWEHCRGSAKPPEKGQACVTSACVRSHGPC